MRKKWIKPELVNIITVEAGKGATGVERVSKTLSYPTINYPTMTTAHQKTTWFGTNTVHTRLTNKTHLTKQRSISKALPIGFHIHFTNTSMTKKKV